jgi:ABC-2 type transport system permease protein
MNSPPETVPQTQPMTEFPADCQQRLREPGVPVIKRVNWGGLRTLYIKEVRRFFKVQLQTIWAPAITTLLFLVIFTVALGSMRPSVLGVPFADFIAPGLIMMGMMQNAFANSSFSLLVGKIQGTIVDFLMPPISVGELLLALVAGAVTRAILVGFAVWALAGRSCDSYPPLGAGLVRHAGLDHARPAWCADINLGRKI